MLMAFIMWMLGQFGVAPTEEDFARYDRDFRERGHHVTVDFGSQHVGTTRWTDDDHYKLFTVGLGYEYLVERHYHGVGFEVLFQNQGQVIDVDRDTHTFFVGGGLAYYPIRDLRLFTHVGAQIGLDGDVDGVGRIGIGYHFMFFNMGMQPYFYVQGTTTGQPGWGIFFRFEY